MDNFNGDSLDHSFIVLLPFLDDGTDAIADAAEPAVVVAAANGAESAASHDDSTESEPLLHVVILHDVDLVGDLRLLQRPRQIGGLCLLLDECIQKKIKNNFFFFVLHFCSF